MYFSDMWDYKKGCKQVLCLKSIAHHCICQLRFQRCKSHTEPTFEHRRLSSLTYDIVPSMLRDSFVQSMTNFGHRCAIPRVSQIYTLVYSIFIAVGGKMFVFIVFYLLFLLLTLSTERDEHPAIIEPQFNHYEIKYTHVSQREHQIMSVSHDPDLEAM